MVYFPGDDLLAINRPRGLPIGNLTSQFWSNVYMTGLDRFVKKTLRCPAYLRYVDDFALFSDSKKQLWEWKRAVVGYLATQRLTIHEISRSGAAGSNRHPLAGLRGLSRPPPAEAAPGRGLPAAAALVSPVLRRRRDHDG
ncbi:MAG: RNA-directed DNA polymerase [Anaerolineae bacterium]